MHSGNSCYNDAMSKAEPVTKSEVQEIVQEIVEKAVARSAEKVTEDIATVLDVMMTRIDERFVRVEAVLDKHTQQIDYILIRLDGIEKRLDTIEHEHAAVNTQLTRHDAWVHELATHTRYTLSAP